MTATAANAKPTALPLRNDTLLGVCEALGQDFRVNPTWFRLAFVAPLFFAPIATVAAYLGVGALVALTRWIAPAWVDASAMTVEATARVIENAPVVEARDERLAA